MAPLPALPVPGLRDRLGARGWGPCPGRESRSGYCGHRAGRRVPVACLLDLLPQPLPPPAPAQTFPANPGGWARAPPPRPAVQPSSPRVPAPYSRPRKTLLPGPPSPPPGAPPQLPAPLHLPRSLRLPHPHLFPLCPLSPHLPASHAPTVLGPSPVSPPSALTPLFSAPTTFVLLPSALSPYSPIPPPLPAAPASHFLALGSCPRPPTPSSFSPTATPGVPPPFVSAPAVKPLAGPGHSPVAPASLGSPPRAWLAPPPLSQNCPSESPPLRGVQGCRPLPSTQPGRSKPDRGLGLDRVH